MTSFTVGPQQANTTAQSLGGNDIGTVEQGGTLSPATNPSLAINLATAPPSGVPYTGVVISNSGTINNTGTGRAIRATGAPTGAVRTIKFTNAAGATITSKDDAFQINSDLAAGSTVTIDNYGGVTATGAGSGQGLDFDAINTAGSTVTITNRAGATISGDDNDGVRPGQGGDVENYGTIAGKAVTTVPAAQPSADGVDFQDAVAPVTTRTGTVQNYVGGTITGARHGINGGTTVNIAVTNDAGGTIIGSNGSGVGLDGTGTVTNAGTITGTIDTTSGRGDGDGVDIDNAATIVNSGLIRGLGAKGNDSGGRANAGEAISIGGGLIQNSGTIFASATTLDGRLTATAGGAIVVNKDGNANRSGVAATTIVNLAGGAIRSDASYAIRLENKGNDAISADTITNYGAITGNGTIPDPNGIVTYVSPSGPTAGQTLADPNSVGTLDGVTYTGTGSARFIRGDGSAIQMGEGNDVLTNYGAITGNSGRVLNLEGGDDTLNLYTGSSVTGRLDGGVGSDTLALRLDDRAVMNTVANHGPNNGETAGTLSNVINFENLAVQGGSWTIADAQSYLTGTSIASGAGLLVDGTVTSTVTVASGGLLGGAGTVAGNVTVGGTISGSAAASGVISSVGTLSTGALTLDATAILREDITGAAADLLSASGAVTLNTGVTLDLEATSAFTSAAGQSITLLDNTSASATTGRIASLMLNGSASATIANDDTFQAYGRSYQISYAGTATGSTAGNDVTITDVTAAPGGGGNPTPTAGDDNLTGTGGADAVALGTGNDTYSGGAGADLAYGNQGNDLIYGNQDADVIYGGQGDDRAFGGMGDDRLYGNLGNDVLYGNMGAEIVYGNQGADIVYGNQGNDLLYGGQGDDVLYGGIGDDILVGGVSDNILVGGIGADRYVFGANPAARDLVLGFNQGEGDRLSLGGQTYTTGTAQNGDALLTLSGGGTIDLAGIRADQVNASYFAA